MKKAAHLIIFTISFLFIGCEKDLYEEPIKSNSENILPDGFLVKSYTEEELESVTNLKPLLILAKEHFYNINPSSPTSQNVTTEEGASLDMSLVTSMEVEEYMSFSIRINGNFEQDVFKNLVIEMFGEDDYLVSIVTYKYDFIDGPYKLEGKEILEGTFNPYLGEDGVTARCSYQFFITGYDSIYCNTTTGETYLKPGQYAFWWAIMCQGGGVGPSNGGIIHGVGIYTGHGASAYSPNPVYTTSEQFLNTLKPMAKTKFNNLYPSARNSIINYISQNLNFPIRLYNVQRFITALGEVDNAQSYNFFNQLVDGHYIGTHNSIKSQIINYMVLNHFDFDLHPLAFGMLSGLFNQEVQVDGCSQLLNYLTNSSDPLKRTIAKNWLKLKKELKNNPLLLIDIPCAEIPQWQALVQFHPPQSVINKIETLDNQSVFTDYSIQYLDHANGAAINLDYFPVTISALPINPVTGQQFTPTQFLNYIRLNINSFVNTNICSFSPTTLNTGYNESQIWNSSNPLGAIIHLNIPQPAGDGSVICSEANSNHWIFTTIEVPFNPLNNNADGIHPVSGNREFGLIQNTNGSFTFYTRGVDRITDGFESLIGENANIAMGSPFDNPDMLWNSLKTKVYDFVQNNSGSAVTPSNNQNRIWRPSWVKVRQVLRGEVSISDLGCN